MFQPRLLLLCQRIINQKNKTSINLLRTVHRITVRRSSTFEQEAKKFMEKHAKRGSPQSPYMLGLTYKFQLTSVLSLTHRITGCALGLIIYGFGVAELACPQKNYSQLLDAYYSILPSCGQMALKLMCGTALAYHTFNGVRHLAWDMGYGFSLPKLYLTGYIVLGLTAITMVALMVSIQQN